MGQFSWHCQDTGERIIAGENKTVYMTDDKGHAWKEECYKGYGVFGGKDFYELLAEMNGKGSDRIAGIDLAFGMTPDGRCQYPNADNPNLCYPTLATEPRFFHGKQPEIDMQQGFPDEWFNEE